MEGEERAFTNGNVLSCCILVCMQLCMLFFIFRFFVADMAHIHDALA
jgi:hypothetical protein